MLSIQTLWGPIVGLVLPVIIGLLIKYSWPQWVKALVALVVAAVVGVGGLAIQGELAWTGDLMAFATLVFTASQVTFWAIVKQIPALEAWLDGHGIHD